MKFTLDLLRDVLHKIESHHDSVTLQHELRAGRLMYFFAKKLGLAKEHCRSLQLAGSLHDVGKLAISPNILQKKAKLTSAERDLIERHPTIGSLFIQSLDDPSKKMLESVILCHHEAYDGSGYPHQLVGDTIPLEARLCTICDVYDALRSYRPYHVGRSKHAAIIELMTGECDGVNMLNKFDPQLLETFIDMKDDIEEVYQG